MGSSAKGRIGKIKHLLIKHDPPFITNKSTIYANKYAKQPTSDARKSVILAKK